jgi:hypothetical protein
MLLAARSGHWQLTPIRLASHGRTCGQYGETQALYTSLVGQFPGWLSQSNPLKDCPSPDQADEAFVAAGMQSSLNPRDTLPAKLVQLPFDLFNTRF